MKGLASGIVGALDSITTSKEEKEKKKEEKKAQKGPRPEDELGMKEIQNKLATPVFSTNIRIVTSAESEAKARPFCPTSRLPLINSKMWEGTVLNLLALQKAS